MIAIIQYDIMRTFADHMEQHLYGSDGYYSCGVKRSGRSGDYFTAPDVGPVFGRILAEIFGNWRDRLKLDVLTLVEVGAGEGRLAQDILSSQPFRYLAVERSESRREILRKIPGIEVYPDLRSTQPIEGVIFGNELIDAFPVHRVRMKNGKLEEAYVGAAPCGRPQSGANELKSVESESNSLIMNSNLGASNPNFGRPQGAAPTMHWAPPSTPRLQSYFDRLGIILPEDYETEVNLAMSDWLREAASVLDKGLLFLIDYGRPAHEYYAPERTGGTLRSFSQHKISANFLDPSRTVDLTSDVDFTSLALDGRQAGFIPLAFMEMGTFLMMGMQSIVGAAPRGRPTGLKYLLHPEGMGAAFHVLILGKNVNPAEWTFEHNRLRRLGLPE